MIFSMCRKTAVRAVAAGFATALTMTSTQAVVLIDEDFESYTPNGAFSTGTAPNWAEIGTTSPATQTFQVAAQSSLSAGTLGLQIVDNNNGQFNPRARHSFAAQTVGALATDHLVWSFDFNMGDALPFNLYIRLHGGSASNDVGPGFSIDRNAEGAVWLRSGNTNIPSPGPLVTLTSNTWYRAVVTIDMVNSTYDVAFLGGTQYAALTTVATNIAFEDAPSVLSDMSFNDNANTNDGGTVYLDNIRLETVPIPEPASLALLGLGAVAMVRRSRVA